MANPITVADAQTHLRLGTLDAAETVELERMIASATEHASAFCNQPFHTTDVVLNCDTLPVGTGALVVNTKVSETPVVTYHDSTHTEQTISGLRHVSRGGRTSVFPAFGAEWPSDCNNEPGSVTLTATADVSDVPPAVQSAILLILGDLYENRETTIVGTSIAVSKTAQSLLTPYKTRAA